MRFSKTSPRTYIAVVAVLLLVVSITVYYVDVDAGGLPAKRQCYGSDPAPDPASFSCITSNTTPGFYATSNAICIAGRLWSSICKEEELGLNPTDGLDLAEEGNIKAGDGQRIPGKPRTFYLARGEYISIKCSKSNPRAARSWAIAGLSEFNQFEGLVRNYSTRSQPPLHQSLRDEWLGMSGLVIEILEKKKADPNVLCL